MDKEIIKKKLENIIKQNKNCIIFFKGFDTSFMEFISEFIPPLYLNKYYDSFGIDILSLINEEKKLVKQLIGIENGIFYGRYEELILLEDMIAKYYDGKIIIINNNLYDIYPYLFKNLNDIYEYSTGINDDEKLEENNYLFNKIFSDIRIFKEQAFVSFLDISNDEIENIIKIDIYNNDLNLIEIKEKQDEDGITVSYPMLAREELSYFKNLIYTNNIKEKVINFEIENYVQSDNIKLNDLNIIIKCANKNGYKINVFKKENILGKQYREELLNILKKYWGDDKYFRTLKFYKDPDISNNLIDVTQGELIEEIVRQTENSKEGKKYQDIFITAPTGSGKSVLFQIPALYFAKSKKNYLSIIVSPLKALMEDQVKNLNKIGVNIAKAINSDTTFEDRKTIIQDIKDGKVSILYLSPEMLIANSNIEQIIGEREIGFVIVDEAHTVSTWGKNFRVDYWYLGHYLDILKKKKGNFVIVSMTATAVYNGNDDLVFDIVKTINMNSPKFYIGSVRRDNISFKISQKEIEGNHREERNQITLSKIKEYIDKKEKSIIYFPWASQIKEMQELFDEEMKIKVAQYYSEVEKEIKINFAKDFGDGSKNVMLATKAFGMGIDIKDIKNVYHHAPSGTLSDYVQEIGRAARLEEIKGVAELEFNEKDLKFSKILSSISSVKHWQIKLLLEKIYELYLLNKRKNKLLVSIDSFSHIFQWKSKNDLEQKVKIGMLLLEKDLFDRYTYPVILVKPRTMFTKNFVVVPSKIDDEVKSSKYNEYFKLIASKEENKKIKNGTIIHDGGDIYEVDLKSIWELYFSDISFGKLKYLFYNSELFEFSEKITPRHKIVIQLDLKKEKAQEKLVEYLDIIEETIYSFTKSFTKADFENKLKEKINDEITIKKITNIIFTLYTVTPDLTTNATSLYKEDGFLRKKTEGEKEVYFIINKLFFKIRSSIIKNFKDIFNEEFQEEFNKYIPIGSSTDKYLEISYILEAFKIGKYELKGGNSPEIFIKINDINKLRILSKNSKYENKNLSKITKSNERSLEIMNYFFTTQLDNNQRWNFIEDYFLGKEVILQE